MSPAAALPEYTGSSSSPSVPGEHGHRLPGAVGQHPVATSEELVVDVDQGGRWRPDAELLGGGDHEGLDEGSVAVASS